MIAGGHGIPLAVILTGANRNDVTQLVPLLESIPPVAGLVGHPKSRPAAVYADRGYDHDKYRRMVTARGIEPNISRRGPHGSGLGQARWVIERTIAYLHGFRRQSLNVSVGDQAGGEAEPGFVDVVAAFPTDA